MKLLVLILVAMVVSCSCMAGESRRGMIGGIYGREEQQRDHFVGNGSGFEERKSAVEDSFDKNIDNHHNIPRQRYDDWGNNSPDNGDEVGAGDDGARAPSGATMEGELVDLELVVIETTFSQGGCGSRPVVVLVLIFLGTVTCVGVVAGVGA
ncbi:hypothetical protein V6N12_046443 [Hibiscus sabdariffa]|uniref:Uncharacterized protein n=1 Tax=Hibiscus sabdariffa TaxID=183260 RepID=A0ABR2DIN3_9ROSI